MNLDSSSNNGYSLLEPLAPCLNGYVWIILRVPIAPVTGCTDIDVYVNNLEMLTLAGGTKCEPQMLIGLWALETVSLFSCFRPYT